MHWVLLLTVLIVVTLVVAMVTDGLVPDSVAAVAGMSLLVTLFLWLIVLVNAAGFVPEMAQVAETRAAVASLGCNASEDVLGTALDFNRDRASNRAWNRRWVADPFIPDGWDTVSVIEMPRCVRVPAEKP